MSTGLHRCLGTRQQHPGPRLLRTTYSLFSTGETTNSGTSFACPMVSGLCALVLANNPGFTPAQVYAVIKTAPTTRPPQPSYAGALGWGGSTARALGGAAPAAVMNLTVDTPDDNGGSVTASWTKSADDGSGAGTLTAYLLLRGISADGPFTQIQELAPVPPATSTRMSPTGRATTTLSHHRWRTHRRQRRRRPAVPANDLPDAITSPPSPIAR